MNWFRVRIPIGIRASRPMDETKFLPSIKATILLAARELRRAHVGYEVAGEHRKLFLQDVLYQAAQVCFPDIFYAKLRTPDFQDYALGWSSGDLGVDDEAGSLEADISDECLRVADCNEEY